MMVDFMQELHLYLYIYYFLAWCQYSDIRDQSIWFVTQRIKLAIVRRNMTGHTVKRHAAMNVEVSVTVTNVKDTSYFSESKYWQIIIFKHY